MPNFAILDKGSKFIENIIVADSITSAQEMFEYVIEITDSNKAFIGQKYNEETGLFEWPSSALEEGGE